MYARLKVILIAAFICANGLLVTGNSVPVSELDLEDDGVVDFTGYKVLRFQVKSVNQSRSLLSLEDEEGIQFWSDPKFVADDEKSESDEAKVDAVDVMVGPEGEEKLGVFLKEQEEKLEYRVLIPDLQEEIDIQFAVEKQDNAVHDGTDAETNMNWEAYQDVNTIHDYLDYLAGLNPDIATVEVFGHSSEGRPLKALKIKSGKAKQTIFIEGGIHAREWITPAATTYFVKELLVNKQNSDLIKDFDWIVVPSINPDGYQYSRKSNRIWRKTRSGSDAAKLYNETGVFADADKKVSRIKRSSGRKRSQCIGVDANRNWGFHWKEGGSSTNMCSETYAGTAAFSEPETKALSEYVLRNNKQNNIILYLAVHSYSQMWLLPWGYTTSPPEDSADLKSLAKVGVDALKKVHGTTYKIGSVPDLLYIASGSSHDWAKGAAGIKYSYTLELRDKGHYGFLLPPKYIQATVEETWQAVKACAENLRVKS